MPNVMIKVDNISKRYRIGAAEVPYKTFREAILSGISAPIRNLSRLRGLTKFKDTDEPDVIWALNSVSFEVEEGEVLMKQGDCLVQRGTNHAWSNRTDKPCLVAFVIIDAQPVKT